MLKKAPFRVSYPFVQRPFWGFLSIWFKAFFRTSYPFLKGLFRGSYPVFKAFLGVPIVFYYNSLRRDSYVSFKVLCRGSYSVPRAIGVGKTNIAGKKLKATVKGQRRGYWTVPKPGSASRTKFKWLPRTVRATISKLPLVNHRHASSRAYFTALCSPLYTVLRKAEPSRYSAGGNE